MPDASIRQARWSNWLLPVAVFLLLGSLSIGWWESQRSRDLADWQETLNRESAGHTLEIGERLKLHANFLRTLHALARIAPPDTSAWKGITEHLDIANNLPGLVAIAYAPALASGQLDTFRQHPRKAHGGFHPGPAGNDLILPVSFVYPATPSIETAIGFDLLSENVRREAIESAIATGEITLSGSIRLAFDDNPQPGFLLLQAIYRSAQPVTTVAQRRRAFVGVLVAAYRVEQFIDSLNSSFRNRFQLRITDLGSQFRGDTEAQAVQIYVSDPQLLAYPAISHELDFGQRTWQLDFIPRDTTPASRGSTLPILLGGLLLSLLLALLVGHLASRRQRAQQTLQQLDQELRRSEERFRLAVAGSNDGLWDQNLLTGEDYTSPRLGEIFGYPPETAPSGSPHYLKHIRPDDEIRRRVALKKHFQENSPYDVEVRIVRSDGKPAWIRLRGEALRDEQGHPVRIAGSITDISARKQAEDELEEVRQLLASILGALPLPIVVLDQERRPVMANPAARLLFQLDDENLRTQAWPDMLNHTPEEECWRLRRVSQRLLDGEQEASLEFPLGLDANRSRSMVAHHVRMAPAAGPVLLVVVLVDVTELREAERELLSHRDHLRELVAARTARLDEALKEARAASAAKSEFLANMSHELRTPMHAILSFSHLGLNRCHEERFRNYFQHIGQSAERLLALINDLLDLSKLEAGAVELNLQPCRLGDLAAQVMHRLEPLWQAKSLQLSITDALSGATAEVDPERVERVLLNLLANAIKFSPEQGRVDIRLHQGQLPTGRRAGDTGTQTAVVVEVCDDGPGIPPGEEEKIFDKFVQSSRTRTGAGGTGLGLSICQEIVARHHGRISALNRPEGGASFIVILPVVSAQGSHS